jgi:hypothetical protein
LLDSITYLLLQQFSQYQSVNINKSNKIKIDFTINWQVNCNIISTTCEMGKPSFSCTKGNTYIYVTLRDGYCSKFTAILKPPEQKYFEPFMNLIEKINDGTHPYKMEYVTYPNIGQEKVCIVTLKTDILGVEETMTMRMYNSRANWSCVIL